jgi:hypothetical protein
MKKRKTAGEVLTEEDWSSLPSPELTKEEKFADYRLAHWVYAICDLDPEAAARASQEMARRPSDLNREIERAERLLEWVELYRDELVRRARSPIRLVGGREDG